MHTNARPPLLWSRRDGWVPPGTRHTHSVPLFNWSLSFTLHHWTGSRGKYGKNGKSRQIPIHARVRTLSCSIFANQIGFSLHEQYGVSEINYFRMKNFRCSSGWSWRAHAHNNMQRIKIGRQQSWHKPHRFAHRQCVAPIRYKRGRNNNKLNKNRKKDEENPKHDWLVRGVVFESTIWTWYPNVLRTPTPTHSHGTHGSISGISVSTPTNH